MSSNVGAVLTALATGAQCSGAQSAAGCCEGKGPFGQIFCGAVCVFCCMECKIGDIIVNGACAGPCPDEPVEPELPAVQPYETITPGDSPRFTASAYGRGLPIVFGSDKLPGNVFWLADFEDHKQVINGTTYFYTTTSFAMAICEGEINAVLRLWLGSRILVDNRASVDVNGVVQPGANGYLQGYNVDLTDKDSPLRALSAPERTTKITIFNGSTSQLPQGVMSDAEGFDFSPGYRGVAYILFENFIVTESSLPNIETEISSNTTNLFPRVFGAKPTGGGAVFTRTFETLHYDISYDLFYVAADNNVTPPYNQGYILFDGNTLEPYQESVVTPDPDGLITNIAFEECHLLNSGLMLIQQSIGNDAKITSYNAYGQVAIETIDGPNFEHSADGFGRWTRGSVSFRGVGSNNLPADILCAPTSDGYGGIGFMECREGGRLRMLGYQNGVVPGTVSNCVYFPVPAAVATTYPTFLDGGSTLGTHILVLSANYNETESFFLTRVTISGDNSLIDPLFTSMGEIDFDVLGGQGSIRDIYKVFQNPTDATLIIFLKGGSTDQAFKYNPYTKTVVWRAKLEEGFPTGVAQDDSTFIPYNNKCAYMSNSNKIVTINLENGETEVVIDDLTVQDLPAPQFGPVVYNGYENSLTYVSTQAGKELVKVFLGRASRAQVTISTILTNLFDRVGWNNVNTVLSDLQTLSLDGYTIHNPTALRQVVSELKQVFTFDLIESNGKIVYKTRGSLPTATIAEYELGDEAQSGWLEEIHEPDFANSRKLNMTYRDLGREYENNVQNIILPKYTNDKLDNDAAIDVQVPIVLEADAAKRLAEILLYGKITYQTSYEFSLPPARQNLDPGDVVTVQTTDEDIIMRLRQVSIGQDKSLRVQAVKEDPDIYRDQVNLFGNIGRYDDGTFDTPLPRLDPVLLNLPARDATETAINSTHSVFYTVLNFRTTSLPVNSTVVSVDTTKYSVAPVTNFPTWGIVTEPLPFRTTYYSTDYTNTLRVKMLSLSGAALANATEDEMLANSGVNLAMVGGELIQFGTVVNEGDGVYAFSILNRCKFGTEPGSANHRRGEYFILLANDLGEFDLGSIRRVDAELGTSQKKAVSIDLRSNNPFQSSLISFYQPTNLRPWTVTDFNAAYDGVDDLYMSWQRRSRSDPEYLDDGDTEQVAFTDGTEEYTLYLIADTSLFTFDDPNSYLRKIVTTSASYTYTLADQVADGVDNLTDDLYVLINHSGSVTGRDPGAATQYRVQHKRV